jgi:hypothetical protein
MGTEAMSTPILGVPLAFTLALILAAWALAFMGDALARRTMRPCLRRRVMRVGWWLLSLTCSGALWVLVIAYADRWVK